MIRPTNPACAFRLPFASQDLPLDILPVILAQLSDHRDWHACALVSRIFSRVATPLLYRTLDSRMPSTGKVSVLIFYGLLSYGETFPVSAKFLQK